MIDYLLGAVVALLLVAVAWQIGKKIAGKHNPELEKRMDEFDDKLEAKYKEAVDVVEKKVDEVKTEVEKKVNEIKK